jgi:hypothetical protein
MAEQKVTIFLTPTSCGWENPGLGKTSKNTLTATESEAVQSTSSTQPASFNWQVNSISDQAGLTRSE